MSIARTTIDYLKGDATLEEYLYACYDPENRKEVCIISGGMLVTSVIGTVWVASKVVKGGAKVHRFLKR